VNNTLHSYIINNSILNSTKLSISSVREGGVLGGVNSVLRYAVRLMRNHFAQYKKSK
jgi:hypothetical protein